MQLDYILWGKDSTISYPIPYYRKDTTKIIYPAWENLYTFINISKFNIDTIPDIMFLIRGQKEIDSVMYDSTLKVIVFGQYGLDSNASITLRNIIFPLQLFPFKAKHLISNMDFTNCNNRGYDFTKTSVFIKSPSMYPPPPKIGELNPMLEDGSEVFVYPNPTQTEINVKTEGMELGSYILEIYSLDGELIIQDGLKIFQADEIKNINISKLTNGTYILILSKDNQIFKTVKFIKNI